RRRHTRFSRDWSSDVCSSDLFNVYARIDGFHGKDGKIFLNDPNTTSGMMPSSFFFHQAAEIGLRPSAFLSYLIETSLEERIRKRSEERRVGKECRYRWSLEH